MVSDETYMQRCLTLATCGSGRVSPNPLVGCVIVCDEKIIGEGFHRSYGGPHAEVHAVASVRDERLLEKATLYVNLEPCAHYGKTPPCAELIVRKRIPRVVIANTDPFPQVAGRGIALLREAGVEVKQGVLEAQGRRLNARFFTSIENKRPYIILKWAQSIDGFIDIERRASSPAKPYWITDEFARVRVHKWRTVEDAIMVGTNTVLKDNPSLTARDWAGRNPLRVVIDRSLRIPASAAVFDNQAPTLLLTAETPVSGRGDVERIDFSAAGFLPAVLRALHSRNVQSVIVEGGAQLLNTFIQAGIWDEARIFTGYSPFFRGVKAPAMPSGQLTAQVQEGNNVLQIIENEISNSLNNPIT